MVTLSLVIGLLLLDRHGLGAQVEHALPLDDRDDPVEAGPAHGVVAPEAEHHAALIFLRDADAREAEDDRDGANHELHTHG